MEPQLFVKYLLYPNISTIYYMLTKNNKGQHISKFSIKYTSTTHIVINLCDGVSNFYILPLPLYLPTPPAALIICVYFQFVCSCQYRLLLAVVWLDAWVHPFIYIERLTVFFTCRKNGLGYAQYQKTLTAYSGG